MDLELETQGVLSHLKKTLFLLCDVSKFEKSHKKCCLCFFFRMCSALQSCLYLCLVMWERVLTKDNAKE